MSKRLEKLWIASSPLSFGGVDEAQLVKVLESQEQGTILAPLTSVDQLMLKRDGTTLVDNLRYSEGAFRHVCGMACAGLAHLVDDLIGYRFRSATNVSEQSFGDAINIFNNLLRIRADRFLGLLQLVRDLPESRIDGMVGMGYRWLSNYDLYRQVMSLLESQGRPEKFSAAHLHARHLTMLLSPRADNCIPGTTDYRIGFRFRNSEVGDSSVLADMILIRKDMLHMGITRVSRTVHSGKAFFKRLGRSLSSSLQRTPDVDKLVSCLNTMHDTLLGFTGSPDPSGDDKRFNQLLRWLLSARIQLSLAHRVMKNALVQGGDDKPMNEVDVTLFRRDVWPRRTTYDIFVSLLRTADSAPLRSRAAIERFAWRLMMGRAILPSY